MATVLLVHGGLHGGWCWERVVPLLEAAGMHVLAPDLPGMGTDCTPAKDITLDLWAGFIADLAGQQSQPPILVGHSRGGTVISAAAERAPDAIAGLVYLTAMLLPDGESMSNAASRGIVHHDIHIRVTHDGLSTTYDPAAAPDIFYNHTDPAIAAAAIARLTPEPIAPNVDPVRITPDRFGRIPRAYIECRDDHAIPLAFQRAMHTALPCDPVLSLDSDHSPFLSQPEALVHHLVTIVAGWKA